MRNKLYKILAAGFALALAFTLSCSSDNEDSNRSYYASLYGISDGAFCQYLDEMLLGSSGNITDDDLEGKGYSFADLRGAWDQYRLSGTGTMLFSQGGYTEDVLRARMTQEAWLTPSQLNAYMRGLNQRGNQLSMHLTRESVNYNSYCYGFLYVEKE